MLPLSTSSALRKLVYKETTWGFGKLIDMSQVHTTDMASCELTLVPVRLELGFFDRHTSALVPRGISCTAVDVDAVNLIFFADRYLNICCAPEHVLVNTKLLDRRT